MVGEGNLKKIYVIAAATILLSVIYQLSLMTYFFPANDFMGTIAKIWFFSESKFGISPYWYSGMHLFDLYPPFGIILAYFIYNIVGNLGASLFLEVFVFIIILLIGFFLFGKLKGISKLDTFFLFLIFIINPITTSWFFKYGRTTEFSGWIFFVFVLYFAYRYKERSLDRYFPLIVIPMTLMLFSHPAPALMSSFPMLALLISKINKPEQFLAIILAILLSLLISSIWWLPMIKARSTGDYVNFVELRLSSKGVGFLEYLIYPVLFTSLALYLIFSKKNSKYTAIPISALVIVYLVFVISLVTENKMLLSIFNTLSLRIFPIAIFLILVAETKKEWLSNKRIIVVAALFSLGAIYFINPINYPYSTDNALFGDSVKLLERNEPGRFIAIYNDNYFPVTLYSYAPIYHNYTTPYGWFVQQESSELALLKKDLESGDCNKINSAIKKLDVKLIISDQCEKLMNECKLMKIDNEKSVCLLQKVNN
jgi:hypothetical protein